MEYNSESHQRFVIKRSGIKQRFYFDKITTRLENLLSDEEKKMIDCSLITEKVIKIIYSGITSEELDNESAKICHNLCSSNPLYNKLAGRILISNLHKKNKMTFTEKTQYIWDMYSENPMLNQEYYNYVIKNSKTLNEIIDYNKDFNFEYFGFKTLENAYLTKDSNNNVIETPQDMLLRVAVFLNFKFDNIEMIKKTYKYLSDNLYIHASPTLFNAGMKRSQLASCFLLGTQDSIDGITKTWADVSEISKNGGGIGIHISNVRSKGATIKSTNGKAKGLIPMLKVYNEICRYVNQGGRRKGSFAFYLEPHHPDLLDFLELKKNFGLETERARDIFLALWVSDLFMKQVESKGDWYFFCPDKCPGLNEIFGDDYEKLYWKYVEEKKYTRKMPAQDVMRAILEAQIETGVPYIAFKDSINRKSNQKNLGTIKSSNLCIEIMQYSNSNEYATCNLASIPINKYLIPFKVEEEFIIYTKQNCKYCKWAKNYMKFNKYNFKEIEDDEGLLFIQNYQIKDLYADGTTKVTFPQIFYGDKYIGGFDEMYQFTSDKYDFKSLEECAYLATVNLNNVIDINCYPCDETKRSNMKHRPIGLGIQGLSDALIRMKIPFDSNESVNFNKKFMEAIYKGGVKASVDIAEERYNFIKSIKNYISENNLEIPEFYNESFKIDNEPINKIYHKFRINKYDLTNTYALGSYSSFEGSPASNGILQFDMWETVPSDIDFWNNIKKRIKQYGMRNSLITALMPTASTSNIMGNTECFEPYTNNIYTRKILAGDFVIINKHMINDMIAIGEWNNDVKDFMIADNGSIQKLSISSKFKELYKTMWEIKQIWVLKNALARSPFVDQSQSMNIYMGVPNFKKLYSSHFYAWKNGLKTGMYYLKSRPARDATKFTVDYNIQKRLEEECLLCSA
tara:strand:- start:44 stop:2770 length:2727 start_codon:yes stop_codon:yes gene_type:complete